MLNRRGRIIITVVSLSALIIILDCIIGFTMGGVFTVKHWLIVIPINAVLSLLSILFIKGKEYIKSKKMLEPFIFITVLLVAASCLFMLGLARLGTESQGIQYDTVIEECCSEPKSPRTTVKFYDKDGNLQTVYVYKQMWFDDESVPETGAKITIKETENAFGDTLYTIEKVNGRIQQ